MDCQLCPKCNKDALELSYDHLVNNNIIEETMTCRYCGFKYINIFEITSKKFIGTK